jgi:hypothetical protein
VIILNEIHVPMINHLIKGWKMINKHYLFWEKANTFGNTYNPINKVLVLNKVVGANDDPFLKKSIVSNKYLLLCKNNLTCLKGNMG